MAIIHYHKRCHGFLGGDYFPRQPGNQIVHWLQKFVSFGINVRPLIFYKKHMAQGIRARMSRCKARQFDPFEQLHQPVALNIRKSCGNFAIIGATAVIKPMNRPHKGFAVLIDRDDHRPLGITSHGNNVPGRDVGLADNFSGRIFGTDPPFFRILLGSPPRQ